MVRITAEGGEKLSVKVIVNARYLPKMLMGFSRRGRPPSAGDRQVGSTG